MYYLVISDWRLLIYSKKKTSNVAVYFNTAILYPSTHNYSYLPQSPNLSVPLTATYICPTLPICLFHSQPSISAPLSLSVCSTHNHPNLSHSPIIRVCLPHSSTIPLSLPHSPTIQNFPTLWPSISVPIISHLHTCVQPSHQTFISVRPIHRSFTCNKVIPSHELDLRCCHIWDPICNSVTLGTWINPLKTKRRMLYLKNQSVPRSKHFSSRL